MTERLHAFIDTPEAGRQDGTPFSAVLIVKDCDTGRLCSVEIAGDAFDPSRGLTNVQVWERHLKPALYQACRWAKADAD